MAEWLAKNGHEPDARVFAVAGCFPGVRKALLARGWVDHYPRNPLRNRAIVYDEWESLPDDLESSSKACAYNSQLEGLRG